MSGVLDELLRKAAEGPHLPVTVGSGEWLDEIDALASRATPGPWRFIRDQGIGVHRSSCALVQDGGISIENGRLIAAARTAVPELVDELRRARDVAVQLEQQIARALTSHPKVAFGGLTFCHRCATRWPCGTARALGHES